MSRILKINESGWRDFIRRNKKYTIDDLYVDDVEIEERVNEPSDSDMCLGIKFQYLGHAKDLDITNYVSRGVFRKTTDVYGKYKFGTFNTGDIWFYPVNIFNKLKDISINKLGYRVGQDVYIKPLDVNGKITSIQLLAIYNTYDEVFKSGIKYIYTLAYLVEVPGSKTSYYQASKLDIINSTKSPSIVDGEIEDNFLELIDDRLLTFASSEERIKDSIRYNCRLNITINTPELLDKISSQLLVMSKRLAYKNIKVDIKSISLDGIAFTATQT